VFIDMTLVNIIIFHLNNYFQMILGLRRPDPRKSYL